MTVLFNQAFRNAALAASTVGAKYNKPVRVIRDVFGRIRFAVDCMQAEWPAEGDQELTDALRTLGPYAGNGAAVLYRDAFSDPEAVFGDVGWHVTTVVGQPDESEAHKGYRVELLDRQISGQDWLSVPEEPASPRAHRVVFFGLKGGVGRSTALTMVAYGLARAGKRVLLIDFDLESPGLSGLLLPSDRTPEFGVIDWFIEDGLGQGDVVLPGATATSPLAETTSGSIVVAPAMGNEEYAYLAKLARAYVEVPSSSGPQRLSQRMKRIVHLLEAQENPDVILIDSRAGLHDIAAISITALADTALLFATDSAQNWQGYEQLFAHWQQRPEIASEVRERLAIVQALAPKTNREARSKRFLEQAYELFANTLYDEIEAGSSESADKFSPPMQDEAAPHFPIRVDWDEVFQEFDPRVRPENGGVSEAEIDAKFGALISWVTRRVSANGST